MAVNNDASVWIIIDRFFSFLDNLPCDMNGIIGVVPRKFFNQGSELIRDIIVAIKET